jgi:hypothetical protein
MPVLMEGDAGSFDFAGRIAGRDSACFAQDDRAFRFMAHRALGFFLLDSVLVL